MQKGYKIALLLETSRHYGRELTKGIARYSRLAGPWSFYREDRFYVNSRKKKDISFLKKWGPDGIIARDFKGALSLLELGVPIISAKNLGYLEDTVQIITDDEAIGKQAFDHFSTKGFKSFAYCGFSNMPWSKQREHSFVNMVRHKDLNIHVFNSHSSSRMLRTNTEYQRIAKWLKSLPKPVGVFCCNDDRGYDLIEAGKIADLEIPYEVAVLGVDNDLQLCDISNPPLSSIFLGIEKAGYEAAATLHKLIEKEAIDSDQIVVQPLNVVVRRSTDIMANEDKTVTEALRFIHETSRRLIQTVDVARVVSSSRRNLDEKFCKILGHSVFSEIRRARTDNICHFLIETDLTVSDISRVLGYNDPNHIARYFKKEKGMTPKLFRKTYGLKKTYYKTR